MRDRMIEIPESCIYNIWTNARCVGNPGYGGFGIVFLNDINSKIAEYKERVEYGTNNTIEYEAIIRAFGFLRENKRFESELLFNINNEVISKQINGIYRATSGRLGDLHSLIKKEELFFKKVRYKEVPRGGEWTKYTKELARLVSS